MRRCVFVAGVALAVSCSSTEVAKGGAQPAPSSNSALQANADAIFTWDYEKGARPALNKLYEKAK